MRFCCGTISFYQQFCPLVLTEECLRKGYMHLNQPMTRPLLRGRSGRSGQLRLPRLPGGSRPVAGGFQPVTVRRTFQANCEQVGQIVYNATKQMPGAVSSL